MFGGPADLALTIVRITALTIGEAFDAARDALVRKLLANVHVPGCTTCHPRQTPLT